MALTAEVVQSTWTDADRVIDEATRIYRLRREPVESMALSDMITSGRVADVPCVVATQQRIVEIAVDDERHLAPLVTSAWHLEEHGWRTTVLVPLRLVGDAHRLLRGAPALLQPWWIHEGSVVFGAFERP